MKLVRIFVSEDSGDGIWSIQFDMEVRNEFKKFFDRVHDIEWLYDFFEKNNADLTYGFFGNITIGDAISRTLAEIEEMRDALYYYAEQGFEGKGNNLQHFFAPLNNFEYAITTHQKSKARIGRGWLRVYGIRLAENCYLVAGGSIKLTQDMRRPHLQNELIKLERIKEFLRNKGINYPEDLKTYQDD